jgi:ParB-like chromosome segregation protein Spo0J
MYIAIENILLDDNLYPRNQVYWKHTQILMSAMKTGATMPPVVVGKRDGRYVIIDGRHRYEAHRRLKELKIAAMVTHLKEDQWFAEAVRLNTVHGHGLSYQEKLAASMILQRANYQTEEIAKIVHIPLEVLLKAIAERGSWLNPEDIKPVVAKAPIAKEAKRRGRQWFEKAVEKGLEKEQRILSGASFERLAEELLVLLNDNHLDKDDKEVVKLIFALVKAGNDWIKEHIEPEEGAA